MLTPGEILHGRYEILELLARGGMGAVYRARRILLGDDVAVKVLGTPDDTSLRERFLRESRAAAQLRHPNIVGVLDYDVDEGGHPFLVMEYLNGQSLLQRLALERRLALDEVRRLVPDLCSALQLAHDSGVVHRDLKPANVVSHEYQPGYYVHKVVDFGLVNVREMAGALKLTMDRQFLGTVAYASPEQLRGEDVDARADVYSFSAMLYQLLTGRTPFEHDDPFVVITRHLTMTPPPPGELVPGGLPPHVEAAILKGLAKNPDERHASMTALAHAFGEPASPVSHVVPVAGPPVEPPPPDVPGYVVGDLVMKGRFGSRIYQGTHRALGAPMAIRVLRRDDVEDWEAARQRFIHEAQAMQVTHPSVLHVRDFGEGDGFVYLVTDFVEGISLEQLLAREGPLPWPMLSRLVNQLVDAVAALHRRGAFICGISPRVTRMTPEDDDFRVVVSSGGVTQVQDLLGTISVAALRGSELRDSELPYVAPEVLMGEAPTVASDLFTIGTFAYTMATGTPPFSEPTLPQLLGAMLRTTPAPIATIRPDVPQAFSDAIARTLSPVPGDRPSDARALAFLLP